MGPLKPNILNPQWFELQVSTICDPLQGSSYPIKKSIAIAIAILASISIGLPPQTMGHRSQAVKARLNLTVVESFDGMSEAEPAGAGGAEPWKVEGPPPWFV